MARKKKVPETEPELKPDVPSVENKPKNSIDPLLIITDPFVIGGAVYHFMCYKMANSFDGIVNAYKYLENAGGAFGNVAVHLAELASHQAVNPNWAIIPGAVASGVLMIAAPLATGVLTREGFIWAAKKGKALWDKSFGRPVQVFDFSMTWEKARKIGWNASKGFLLVEIPSTLWGMASQAINNAGHNSLGQWFSDGVVAGLLDPIQTVANIVNQPVSGITHNPLVNVPLSVAITTIAVPVASLAARKAGKGMAEWGGEHINRRFPFIRSMYRWRKYGIWESTMAPPEVQVIEPAPSRAISQEYIITETGEHIPVPGQARITQPLTPEAKEAAASAMQGSMERPGEAENNQFQVPVKNSRIQLQNLQAEDKRTR